MASILLMTLALMANLSIVKANGTIYIGVEGSIDPPTAPIASESFGVSELVPFLDTFTTVMESNTTDWDTVIGTPFVVYDAGLYKMWYSASSGPSPPREVIACAESTDAITWVNKQIVHNSGTGYYCTGSPWVIGENGTYRMWHMDYYEWIAGEWSAYIAHMTSTDGTSWPAFMSAGDQKVLSAQGQNGVPQGDGYHISQACVIHEPGGYVMWYTVNDVHVPDGGSKIWWATSTDGITWTNRQLSLPYVSDTWEDSVGPTSVVKEDDGTYTMFYSAWYPNQTQEAIGIAKSFDGITWTERKQFLRAADLGANVTFIGGSTQLIHFTDVDGKRYLYFNYYDKGDGNKSKFGRIQLGFIGGHDVAITSVAPSKTVVGQGHSLNMNVTAANQGDYTEILNVTVYANTTSITSQTINLTSRNSTILAFTWNTTGFAKGNYTIRAYAWPVPGETDILDNTFVSPSIIHSVMLGDANFDGKIDILDVVMVTNRYGSKKGELNYDPNVDWNCDGRIDILDAVTVTSRYGFIDP